jgi:hypothetical protein
MKRGVQLQACAVLAVIVGSAWADPAFGQSHFRRGDANGDGRTDLSDAVFTLGSLFLGVPRSLPCLDAADSNDDGTVNISDASYSLSFLFLGGPALPAPGLRCGADPTEDRIGCDSYPGCEVPEIILSDSDNEGLKGSVLFDPPLAWKVDVNGEVFTQISVPGTDPHLGEPGMPGVPVLRRLVAIPQGAEAFIEATAGGEVLAGETLLLPFQSDPADQESNDDVFPPSKAFDDPPFRLDTKVYSTDGLFPPEIATVRVVGQVRDLWIASLEIATGQYNPRSRKLRMFDKVDFSIGFKGGNGAFLTEASMSPFESAPDNYIGAVLNQDVVTRFVAPDFRKLECLGEEFLILTHPDFRSAADRLAEWKRAKGISTTVIDVNDGAGPGPDSAEDIDRLIERRYDQCQVRPSYVLLFGDAEYLPTFYPETQDVGVVGTDTIGSDYRYSIYVQFLIDVFFPDFGVGRIPVDTLGQADIVVDKIIGYEKTPPTDANFYKNISVASQFQCCRTDVAQNGRDQRTFAEVSEFVRPELLAHGYTVERIYTETVDADYGGDTTPRRWFDGTPIPAAIGPGSGFAWDGSRQKIIDAFNDGRFLIFHRDHGGPGGWVNPPFSTTDVSNSLTNGDLLPVVFSVNCASGLFDNETAVGALGTNAGGVYFAERLLRKADGGAVGILGDTRNSPSWPNSSLSRGFFDAIWPNTVPGFGGATSKKRLGDILVHGKIHMLSEMGTPAAGIEFEDAIDELNLWHVIGDPTLQIWTSRPLRLPTRFLAEFLVDLVKVQYEGEGADVTAWEVSGKDLLPLGRGKVKKGTATLPLLRRINPEARIVFSASLDERIGTLLSSGPEPIDLDDESSFTKNARRITFDASEGRQVGEHVSEQYSRIGVTFADTKGTTPTIDDGTSRRRKTHSSTQSLVNVPDLPAGSAKIPLTMTFKPAVRRVGAYVGNGDGTRLFRAGLTAFDANGDPIFSVTRAGVLEDVQTFIGLDAGADRIAEVRIDYGSSPRAEEIDDLLFE